MRQILAARCPAFFAPMFTRKFSEAASETVQIKDISPKVLAHVLRFLYTDRMHDPKPQELIDILRVGNMWQLPRLVSLCVGLRWLLETC